MKKLIYFLVLINMAVIGYASADSFIEGMEDVPVMPKMKQIPSDTISFGGVDSHFLEAVLVEEEPLDADSYRQYYTETLPQFGWELARSKDLKMVFHRGDETLEITREYAKPLTIRINIFGEN